MLTVKEAAKRLGVSPSTVYRWVDIGELEAECPAKPIPINRKRRYKGPIAIPEAQVNELLRQATDAA